MVRSLLVALDLPAADHALGMARALQPHVGGFKVGLELLMGEGPSVVARVAELGAPVFVDAKLHDIPNTVAGAARQLGALGARWVTVHGTGGDEMVRVAADELAVGSEGEAGILVVSVLTSLDAPALAAVGVSRSLGDQVQAMSRLAAIAGAEGVVCAVSEASLVKSLGLELKVVTPGIRPAGSISSDQRRVATPAEAIAQGADLLVVGRPIINAPDPVASAVAIAEEIQEAASGA